MFYLFGPVCLLVCLLVYLFVRLDLFGLFVCFPVSMFFW